MSRRLLYLAVVLIWTSMAAWGASDGYVAKLATETTDALTFDFGIKDFQIADFPVGQTMYSDIEMNGGKFSIDKGAPEVRYFQYSFRLQSDTDVALNILDSHFTEYQLQYPLKPSRGTIYHCQDRCAVPYVCGEAYSQDGWYPREAVKLLEPFIARDRRGVSVQFYPFQYNPRTMVLRVYDHIQIRLDQMQSKTAINALPMGEKALQGPSLFDNIFVNPVRTHWDHAIPETGDLLVIHTARDATAIQPYIQWKKEKGFKVTTLQVATGTNVQSSILNACNANRNLLYVQLVGDWADIKGPATSLGEPLDVKMAEVAGSDRFPDIIIGRFCASSAAEVTNQVNKAINYEKTPDLAGAWYHKGLGIGGDDGPSDDEQSDWEQVDAIKKNKLLKSTYTEVAEAYHDSVATSAVTTPINAGVGIVNYSDHGAYNELPIGSITNSVADGLNNGSKLFFLTAVACNPGEFSRDCVAKHLLKNTHGGAVCAWLSSISQPWYPPYYAQDYFNDLLIGGYDYSAHPGTGNGITTTEGRTTFGGLTYNAMALMYTEDSSTDALNTMEAFINFGDVSLQVRTDTPKAVTITNSSQIPTGTYVTNVKASSVNCKGAWVTITQGTNSFTGVSDASGNVSIPHTLSSGSATLVVTGFNLETKYLTSIPVVAASNPNDINGDGSVNSADAVLLAQMATATVPLNGKEDVNKDGTFDSLDLVTLQNALITF